MAAFTGQVVFRGPGSVLWGYNGCRIQAGWGSTGARDVGGGQV